MTNAKQSFHEYLAAHGDARRLLATWIAEQCERLRNQLEHGEEAKLVDVRAELRVIRALGRELTTAEGVLKRG